MNKVIILASQSPRRKELLSLCVEEFDVLAADIDEKGIERSVMAKETNEPFLERAKIVVETLAYEKAKTVLEQHPNAIVIGADTVVVHDNRILGKPEDETEAYKMLRSFAGRTHMVLTGFSIQTKEKTVTTSIMTEVRFFDWDEQMEKELQAYIASGSPMDKAGAYGIQDKAGLWVAEIHGDYTNVIGLPIGYVNRELRKFFS